MTATPLFDRVIAIETIPYARHEMPARNLALLNVVGDEGIMFQLNQEIRSPPIRQGPIISLQKAEKSTVIDLFSNFYHIFIESKATFNTTKVLTILCKT